MAEQEGWLRRHLLGLEELSRQEIELILDTALSMKGILFRKIKKVPTLRGKTVVNIFYEPSTRTRTSFEIAAKVLSADTLSFSRATSSVTKGENLLDTVRNILAMRVDTVVIRHAAAGTPHFLARNISCPVINAGDGMHEHPTQALLDMLTIREHFGRIKGLKVSIIGDIYHSRVARSNMFGLLKLGAEVTLCGPKTLLPPGINSYSPTGKLSVTSSLTEALQDADVVYVLRIQQERMQTCFLPSLREYIRLYRVDRERIEKYTPDHAIVMHPGPINRNIELADDVADSGRAVILEQVTNGVAVRMAVLYLLTGGSSADEESGN